MATANRHLIAGNDEHGVNPPTPGKRTPVMPYIDRPIYENEFNRPAKNVFLEACVRCGFRVYDVKPEEQDISVTTRVRRVNSVGATLVVTFAYNAFGDGTSFNAANGFQVFYGNANPYPSESRLLSFDVDAAIAESVSLRNRGVAVLQNVGMLNSVRCPSTLVEAGFMTNFEEAKLMLDPDFVSAIGNSAAKGVCQTLDVPFVSSIPVTDLPTLRRGSRGQDVQYLQWLLINEGYPLTADGIFGQATQDAVLAFQANNGLAADGIVGKRTWTALTTFPDPLPVLRRGSRGKSVRYLQQKLLAKLYPVGIADGIFGSNTERQVKAFQEENGLTADGIVGKNTWAKLVPVGGGRPLPASYAEAEE